MASDAQVLSQVTDVAKAEQLDQLVEAAVKQFGRVDYAVNGAGMSGYPWLYELLLTKFYQVFSATIRSRARHLLRSSTESTASTTVAAGYHLEQRSSKCSSKSLFQLTTDDLAVVDR